MSQINIQKYSSFLAHLRQMGFIIGTGHYLQLQAILNLAGEDASDLKYLLCPVFAKSEKQQAQFYLAFDSFFAPQVRAEIADKDNAEAAQMPEMPRKWRYVLFGILMLANVVLYYLAKDDIKFAWNSLTSKEIQTKPVEMPQKPIEPTNPKDKPSQPDKPIVEQPKLTFYQQYWQIIRWIGILAPILVFLLTEWYRYDRRKLILQRESSRKPPYSWELNIESPDVRFLKNEQFYTTARLMRQRLESDIQIPDMEKTVKETIASAGFPKFCYKSLTKPPEYLILIDLPTHRDHYASLADQIAESLKSEDIFVKRYFYENSPQICFEELTQERVYLSDLQAKFSESRLIVFGNGEEMLNPVSGEAEAWTEIFHAWQDRAILTPERPQHWGMREITLAEQFIVLPDTSEGLIELARHFDAASMPDLKKWHEEDVNPDISEDKLNDIKALQEYLGEDAFQWLCACAVYPELHWNLTLYLGMTDKKWLTEDNLLKLIRLPWFRKGVMPDTLRWELITALDKEKNQAIREAIVKMLEKNPPPKDSHAYHQHSLNLAMQKWMLGRKSRKEKQEILKTLRQADENDMVKDYTFLRFLESVPNSPLTFVLPKALRKVLYKNGVPMFGSMLGIRLIVTVLYVILTLLVINPLIPFTKIDSDNFYERKLLFKGIESQYKNILNSDPDNIQKNIKLAMLYYNEGLLKESEAIFKQLGFRSQTEIEIIRLLVQRYIEQKDYKNAAVIIEGMLKGAPDSSELHYVLGVAYEGLNNHEKTIQHLKKVTPDSRFFQNAAAHISYLYQQKGDIEKGIRFLTDVIKRVPDNPEFIVYLASFYEEIKEFEKAEQTILGVLETMPDNIKLLFHLSVIYDKWGRKQNSIEIMKKVISLDPKDANALNYLGYTYADLGENLDEAERLIQQALIYKPDDGYIIDSLGLIYYKKKLYNKALETLKKSLSLVPNDPTILEHIGDVYLILGEKRKALEFYNNSLLKQQKVDNSALKLKEKIKQLREEGIIP